jgi:hypothetical protein
MAAQGNALGRTSDPAQGPEGAEWGLKARAFEAIMIPPFQGYVI